jgi:hypothetical protein
LGDGFAGGNFEDAHLVLRVAAVQDGDETAAGVNGEVHREIADDNLAARGAERPLVREQNRTVVLEPGQDGGRSGAQRSARQQYGREGNRART